MTFISNFPVNFNIQKFSFRSAPVVYNPQLRGESYGDGFTTNPLYSGLESKEQLVDEIKSNPRIKELMKEYKLPLKLNLKELEQLKRGHLQQTRVISAQMYSLLPPELKSQARLPELQEAAMFHDWGKVLIPSSILNKSGKLSADEQEIMQLHSEFGYELLKKKNLSPNSLNMIKNHHTPRDDIGAQILSTADKYSALLEERCYKPALSKEEALQIIKTDAENGLILPEIYEALRKSTEL